MSWQWRVIQKLKTNWLAALKLTWGTSPILTQALESLKKMFFKWLLVTKVYKVWATKVPRSYLSWHLRVMPVLKINWLVVWKMAWEIWRIFLKVSTLGLWWDSFAQSRKDMILKFTKELCVMAMKNNAKFENKLMCHSKTDTRNLTHFDSSTRKSKKIAP